MQPTRYTSAQLHIISGGTHVCNAQNIPVDQSNCMTICTTVLIIHAYVFLSCFCCTVQCIHHVTRMYVKMEALADYTSLSTCVNAFQNSVDHSVRVSNQARLDVTFEGTGRGEIPNGCWVGSINQIINA